MSQDQSVGNSAASPSAQARTPSVRGYRMDSGNIPQEIRSNVATQLGPEADVFPAKENGSYKGPIIHADQGYIVQAVGKDHQTAVVHQRADVQIMGAALQNRDARNDLVNRNLQVHYRGDQAKAYPWDSEKEAAQRAARPQERPADRGAVAGQVLSEAEKYAIANIKNVKQREAFLKHLGNVTQAFQRPGEAEPVLTVNAGQRAQQPNKDDVEYYGIYDGRYDANFTAKNAAEMLEKADKHGWHQFQAHMKDGSIQQVQLGKDDKWVREDGSVLGAGRYIPYTKPDLSKPESYRGWDEQRGSYFSSSSPTEIVRLAEAAKVKSFEAINRDQSSMKVTRDNKGVWTMENGLALNPELKEKNVNAPKSVPSKGQARAINSPSQDIER